MRTKEEQARRMTLTIDINGIIEKVTGDFKELTGYSRSDLIGNEITILIPESHRKRHKEGFSRWNQQGTKRAMGSWIAIPLQHKDSGEIPLQMCLTERQGKVTGLFTSNPKDILDPGQLLDAVEARKVLEKELEIAQKIQSAMLPNIEDSNRYEVSALLVPAKDIGGDFYDFYQLDENWISFVIGDVSGKGIPAALFMSMSRILIKSFASHDRSTAHVITKVNNEIADRNKECMFVTIFMVMFNTTTGEMVYTNAGHNPPYIRRGDGSIEKLSDMHGPVVGAVEGIYYKESRNILNDNDAIILFTDGVTEARDKNQVLFNDNRLLEVIRANNFDDTETITNAIYSAVKNHESGTEQSDDITLLVFKTKPDSVLQC